MSGIRPEQIREKGFTFLSISDHHVVEKKRAIHKMAAKMKEEGRQGGRVGRGGAGIFFHSPYGPQLAAWFSPQASY